MLRGRFCVSVFSLLGFAIALIPAERQVEISLGKSLELGRQELSFGAITSICEDHEGNFLVLDGKEFKVLKFSPGGKLLLKFGQKGQGPGDFQSPDLIVLTPQNEIAVHEISYVSFFKADGTFARRQELNGRLGLVYLGPNRFLAWDWHPDSRQQIMLDGKNNVVATFHAQPRNSFSTVLTDETGRAVMFNYVSDIYVPDLIFGYGGGVGLVGISSRYDLTLLDGGGRVIGSVRRDLKPGKMSGGEKAFLGENIREFAKVRNWPAHAVRDLVNRIPDFKAIIRAVRISPRHVYVFRVPENVTREDSAMPVDVFSLRGEFLGSTTMNKIPLFISGTAMYFVEADDSGNEYLRRTEYSFLVR
ncbi:MAG: hypothetical protein ABSG19_14185 [Candidatus Aminicenantales bacterium]